MTQNPEPGNTPGLEPGGGVPPGETPPSADQMSGTQNPENDKQSYPKSANYGAIAGIALVSLLVGGMLLGMIIVMINNLD
jgi:hypothetical protein